VFEPASFGLDARLPCGLVKGFWVWFSGPWSGFCARHVSGQRHGFLDAVQSPSEAFESHINSAMERRRLRISGPLSIILRFIGEGGNNFRPVSLLISL
jgi:hypothetical protein